MERRKRTDGGSDSDSSDSITCDTTNMAQNTRWCCPSVDTGAQSHHRGGLNHPICTNAENHACGELSMPVDITSEVASGLSHQCLGCECVPSKLEVDFIIFPVQGQLSIAAFKKLKYN